MEKVNLNKLISERSSYSRRQIEKFIKDSLVKINGSIAKAGEKVDPNCKIEINGKKIEQQKKEKIYIKLNKARDYVCSNRIFKGEKNIFSLINTKEKLFSIGRLDKDSSGLIILTNDGDLAYRLSHPKFEHQKKYLIKIKSEDKKIDNEIIKKIYQKFKTGIDIGEKTLAKAKSVKYLGDNCFEVILSEGKKRQIRRMFNFFELEVVELKRIEFSGIKIEQLKESEWKKLSKEELRKLGK